MSAKMNHEELVELLQEGKNRFPPLCYGQRMQMIIWSVCRSHGTDLRMNRLSSMWNRRTSSRWTVR